MNRQNMIMVESVAIDCDDYSWCLSKLGLHNKGITWKYRFDPYQKSGSKHYFYFASERDAVEFKLRFG